MVWLDPDRASIVIAGQTIPLPGVTHVAVDRRATRLVVEHGPLGPHAAFVDAPEQRVDLALTRRIQPGEPAHAALRPGAQGVLSFTARAATGDLGGAQVSAAVVLASVEHSIDAKRGFEQTIRMVGVSSDGLADPVTEGGAP